MKEGLRTWGEGAHGGERILALIAAWLPPAMCLLSTVEQLWLLDLSLHPDCWGPKARC